MAVLLNELMKIERSETKRIKDKAMNLQDEIKKTKELLLQLEVKQAKELAKPKSKRIVIYADGRAYAVMTNGNIDEFYHCSTIENDNAFIDRESAQLQAQRNTLVHKMRLAALECPVDWSDGKDKYYPTWIMRGHYGVGTVYSIRASQLPHFANRLKLEAFMHSLSTDEQKLLICGVE
jgi:hypothetical protein